MAFELFDTVRLVDVVARERILHDTDAGGGTPQLGDTGTVVEIIDDGLYLVESTEEEGGSRWLAEFLEDELEIVA
ncbi:MAG TPA: hypothetical protein VFZ11_05215 [Gemmatimonadaceae bacterium]